MTAPCPPASWRAEAYQESQPPEAARPQVKACGVLQNLKAPPPPLLQPSSIMTSSAFVPVACWSSPREFHSQQSAAFVTVAAGDATAATWQEDQQVPPPPPPRSSLALVPVTLSSGTSTASVPVVPLLPPEWIRSQLPAACVAETHPDEGHKKWSQRLWREILICRCGAQLRSEWFFGGANRGWQKAHGWSTSKKVCCRCL